MSSVFIVAIVFGAIIIAITIFCGTILMAIRLRHGGISLKAKENQTEEAKIIQETYHSLSKMEDRVDALETILMDRQQKEKQNE